MDQEVARPDLSGEVRFRVPLVIAIPVSAILVIGLLAVGFSRILLGLESKEGATALAIVMAANVLAACAYFALRPRLQRASVVELLVVALYPVVIGIALASTGILAEEEHAETTTETSAQEEPGAPAAGATELVAQGIAWNTDTLTFKADEPTELSIDNQDTTVHNMSIYPDEAAAQSQSDVLFKGDDVDPGSSATYEIDPLKKGTYAFVCDYHLNMLGEVVVE
jgi:plastocyanin